MADIPENHSLSVIGRLASVDIPEWDVFDLRAKIDTGAYTSSLHCHHIEHQTTKGKATVRFNLLDPSHDAYNNKLFEWPIFKTKKVKSSNGQSEERIIVKTKVVIANRTILGELSLTDRSEMRYPLLIGRKLIKNKFLVDVSRKFDR